LWGVVLLLSATFYTREFSGLAASVEPFCDSLAELIELHIPLADGAELPTKVQLAHSELALELVVAVAAD
jgi:hypothetical protein